MSADVSVHDGGEFRGTDRFEIVRRIGAGGMGVVYQAFDRERGSAVALKTLRRLDPAAIYHLKQEFRALADVRHPNLVRLHELVSADGQWFFTMELVEGVDFLQFVHHSDLPTPSQETVDAPLARDGADSLGGTPRTSGLRVSPRLDADRLRRALRQLVEGVRALHTAGKLHRDIKPSNIVVTSAGQVTLLDFGLATDLVRQGTLQSIDQHVLGTPEYMSPEQGAARPLTPASDWYSVGVVLFEGLTGGLPFLGSALEILMAKEQSDAASPGSLVEGLPEDLDALCAALLRRDPGKRPTGEEIVARLSREPSPHPPGVSAPPPPARVPLVGRDQQLETLGRAFRRSRQGRAVAVHLHGPAGVGKSAIVRQFIEEAVVTKQALVLSGACYERESVPYKALDGVIDALTRHLRRLTRLQVEALLPRDVHAIARLFPVLARVDAVAAAPRLGVDLPDPSELRRRAFGALRELLARVADRRPLIMVIDDLQWGDLDSIALLGDLLKPPYPPPMLLVAAFRDEDEKDNPMVRALRAVHVADEHAGREQPLVPALVDLRGSTTARRRKRSAMCEVYDVALGPLGDADSRALARNLLEGTGLVDSLADEAKGNPLLIVEYVRWMRANPHLGAERVTLERVIDARVEPLSPVARSILNVLAVGARPIPASIAAGAARVKDERAAIAELRDAQMVRTVRVGEIDALEVWHDSIREAVVSRLPREETADLHLRLASAIEATSAPDPEALTQHFRAAGAKWKASHYAALAARRAEETLAFDRAASLWELAIELAPANAPEVRAHRVMRADALFNAGRGRDAAREYLSAADGAGEGEALELHRRAAQCLLQSGHVDEGLAMFEGVLGALGERLPKSPRRALASLFLRRTQLRLRGLDFVERDDVDPLERARIDVFWALATGFGLVDVIVGADFATRHLLAALRAGDTYRLVRAFTAEATFTAAGGTASITRTRMLVERTMALAEKCGQPHALGLARAAEAGMFYHLGEWATAREKFRRAERIFRDECKGVAWELANVRHFHLATLTFLGELRRLSERVPALLEEASSRGDLLAQTSIRCGHASVLWLAHDDPEGGRRDVVDAVAQWSRRGFLLQHFYELTSLTQFDLYAGNARGAWARLLERWPAMESSLVLRMQRVRVEAWALRARTALAAMRGKESVSMLRDAEKYAHKIEREGVAWGLGFAHATRAALAHTGGDDQRAIEILALASKAFEHSKMRLHAQAARRRLGRLIGGDHGRALIHAADVYMASEDVQDPARMTEMLLPGFV